MFVSNRIKCCHKTIGNDNVVDYCVRDVGPLFLNWIPFFLAIVCGEELVLSLWRGMGIPQKLLGRQVGGVRKAKLT